jgi:PqqD family protein of HPr-rel-A system
MPLSAAFPSRQIPNPSLLSGSLPGTMPQVWITPDGAEILMRNWGDEYVVHSQVTGDTHLLGLVPATALKLLQEHPSGSIDLAARVAQALKLEPDEEFLTLVEQTLADFKRLGLAEQTQL